MPDKRKHRGGHPQDKILFAQDQLDKIRLAVDDFGMLLTKGYAPTSVLKLVGDRYNLSKRQRLCMLRNGCSESQLINRRSKELNIENIREEDIVIDGYNLLITIESALSGGFIFISKDGTYKDLASIHSSYHKVSETYEAIKIIGRFLQEHKTGKVLWVLDRPVSNSGRLKKILLEISSSHDWGWAVELEVSPDKILKQTNKVAVTSDSVILDQCERWVNLAGEIISHRIPNAKIIDLS